MDKFIEICTACLIPSHSVFVERWKNIEFWWLFFKNRLFDWTTFYQIQNILIEFVLLEIAYVECWEQQQIYECFINMLIVFGCWTFIIIEQPIEDIFFYFETFSIYRVDAIRLRLQLTNETLENNVAYIINRRIYRSGEWVTTRNSIEICEWFMAWDIVSQTNNIIHRTVRNLMHHWILWCIYHYICHVRHGRNGCESF